ncbi:MAG: DUF883 family protein [Alphaproteobacteria bacterium]|nr:DUF883 family protein [Alphaproteobacteria bacterium]
MARTKRKTPKDIDNRIDALRADLNSLQDNTKGLATDTADVATGRAQDALRLAEGLAQRALRLAEETASGYRDDIEQWTNDNLDDARERVREQPLAALMVSLGIGAILGALLLR